MGEAITSRQFHASDGVADWRIVFDGARAVFRTETFAAGFALAGRIAMLAEEAGHHPDLDLRYRSVGVRLWTEAVQGITERDVQLARAISAAARELGIAADPSAVQYVQVSIDALSIPTVMPFWRAVLGYEFLGDEDVVDPLKRWPSFWFQQMSEPRTERNRFHIDVSVPQDQAEARVAAGLAAGGRLVRDNAPRHWTLADPEGNEVDIAPWADAR